MFTLSPPQRLLSTAARRAALRMPHAAADDLLRYLRTWALYHLLGYDCPTPPGELDFYEAMTWLAESRIVASPLVGRLQRIYAEAEAIGEIADPQDCERLLRLIRIVEHHAPDPFLTR